MKINYIILFIIILYYTELNLEDLEHTQDIPCFFYSPWA